jgi:hypothetical protein
MLNPHTPFPRIRKSRVIRIITVEIQMADTLVKLVVLGPGTQLYGTRALVAGDQFEMTREWADILIRLGKARLADEKPAPPAHAAQTEKAEAKAKVEAAMTEPNLDSLRHQARALGVNVDGRWTATRLNYEIAQAKPR